PVARLTSCITSVMRVRGNIASIRSASASASGGVAAFTGETCRRPSRNSTPSSSPRRSRRANPFSRRPSSAPRAASHSSAVAGKPRLGRSLAELLATVAMLKRRGIALLSLEEKIDTTSAAGELVFHVFGAIAHFERRLIAERTKDGIAAARARGKRPGRQPLDADKIAAAIKLVKAGLSPTAAARQLGLGRSTVYREVNRAGVERLPPPA